MKAASRRASGSNPRRPGGLSLWDALMWLVEHRTVVDSSTGCRLWQGSKSAGYGTFNYGGVPRYVHVHVLTGNQPSPFSGAVARHKCDTPLCCEETHLEWGSAQDNTDDKMRRGRHFTGVRPKGQEVNTSKFSELDVLAIRRSVKSNKMLADIYGVSYSSIHRIRTGRTWAHVTPTPTSEH